MPGGPVIGEATRRPGSRRAPASIARLAPLALLAALAASLRSPGMPPADDRLAGETGAAPRGGVLVAQAEPGSPLVAAGLAAGDLVVGWRRASGDPSLPAMAGDIASAFDWLWLATEQAPRGELRLAVERQGRRLELAVGRGPWEVRVLPWMPPALAARARSALTLEARPPAAGDTASAETAAATTSRATPAAARDAGAIDCGTARPEHQAGGTDGGLAAAAFGWEALAGGRWASRSPAARCWLLLQAGRDRTAAGQAARAGADYELALRLAQGARARVAVLRGMARALADRSELAAAAALAGEARQAAAAAWGESLELAQAEQDRGAVALARGQEAAAEAAWGRCLGLRERLAPGSPELAAVLGLLAGPALARGDLDRASALAGRALAIARRLAAPGLEAAPLMVLGSVARDRGDPDQALRLLRLALERHAAAAPDLTTAEILNRLGTVARRRGELGSAQGWYERSLAIWNRLAPASLGRTNVLLNLGWVASDRGLLGAARSCMEQAVAVRERLQPGSLSLATGLGQLALVVEDQGELELAAGLLERELGILARTAPGGMREALAMGDLGELTLRRGAPDRAAALCARAVAIQERLAPGNPVVAGNLETLAEAELARHHLDAAGDAAGRAARLVEANGEGDASRLLPTVLAVQGEVARQRGEPGRAVRLFRQALALQERQGYGAYEVADVLHALGTLERRRHPAAAARYFNRAIAMLEEQIRKLGGSRELQAAYRARHQAFYRDAIELAVDRRLPQAALGLVERSRGQALLAQLAERDPGFARDVPPALRREERAVAAAVDAASLRLLQLDRLGETAQLSQLRGRLAELHRRHDEIVARLGQASPRYVALVHPVPLDASGVRRALDPETVMLSYSLGERGSTLFVLSRTGPLEVHRLPAGEAELRRRVTELRWLIGEARGSSSLGRARRAALLRAARELYGILLRPAARRIAAGRRLLVVPDGILDLLPWAALVRDLPATAGRGWEYVAEWKPIHVAVSATVYDELRRRRPEAMPRAAGAPRGAVSLVAFADPQVPSWLQAPLPRQAADVSLRSALERGCSFERLPYSRQEAAGIAALFPGAARVYLGAAATEERAKAVGRQVRYLHFATHTTLDERSPLDSAVVLTIPERFARGAENGLLQAWEIFDTVRLDADLVVLSGCESALGKEVDGEGLLGLTRAFQYAGARAVMASLWKVSDRMTAPLMVSFYRALRAGTPKDEALRQAQVELLRGGAAGATGGGGEDDPSPFFWAGFELFGDWR
jgi:CHAT domain-containing protein/tetratricopeptide (TPR) repeat protein